MRFKGYDERTLDQAHPKKKRKKKVNGPAGTMRQKKRDKMKQEKDVVRSHSGQMSRTSDKEGSVETHCRAGTLTGQRT